MWGKDLARSAVRGGLLCLPLSYARRVERRSVTGLFPRGRIGWFFGGWLAADWLLMMTDLREGRGGGGIMMCRWGDGAWINGGGIFSLVFGPCVGWVGEPTSFFFALCGSFSIKCNGW